LPQRRTNAFDAENASARDVEIGSVPALNRPDRLEDARPLAILRSGANPVL